MTGNDSKPDEHLQVRGGVNFVRVTREQRKQLQLIWIAPRNGTISFQVKLKAHTEKTY